ncbi:glycosyltransferase [Verrucomicrobiota bacterium]
MGEEELKQNKRVPLSVVIPTLGRPVLAQTLKSIISADGFEDIEVIVLGRILDHGVRAELSSLISKYPQVHWEDVSYERGDLSKKKNRGLEKSFSDIVAFIDDDLIVCPQWLRLISEPFLDPGVGMVCGPSLLPEHLPYMARLSGLVLASKASGFVADRYNKGNNGLHEARWHQMIGCNMACRRSFIEKIGGFNTDIIPGEDLLVAYEMSKNGYKLMFYPDAYVHHYPRQSLKSFCRQVYRFGLARVRMFRYGVNVQIMTLLPGVWIGSIIFLTLLSFFTPIALLFLAIASGAYVCFVLFVTFDVICRTRCLKDLLVFVLIPIMHASYGVAQWVEFIRPNKILDETSVGTS